MVHCALSHLGYGSQELATDALTTSSLDHENRFHQETSRSQSGKRLYPHLLRTLFFSEGVRAGKDINFLSAAMNIDPAPGRPTAAPG
jgi:hypothetical protein